MPAEVFSRNQFITLASMKFLTSAYTEPSLSIQFLLAGSVKRGSSIDYFADRKGLALDALLGFPLL